MGSKRAAQRIRKQAEQKRDPVKDRARELLIPEAQINQGGMTLHDVSNRTEADQRHSMRSAQTQTIRKLTRIEKLRRAGTLSKEEAAACEWYAGAFEQGYATLGITCQYGVAGSGGDRAYGHLARYAEQERARVDYARGRAAIPGGLVRLFESVILHGRPIIAWQDHCQLGRSQRSTRLSSSFRLAVRKLVEQVGRLAPAE